MVVGVVGENRNGHRNNGKKNTESTEPRLESLKVIYSGRSETLYQMVIPNL